MFGCKPAASVRVAFGPGVTPSALIRRYGVSKDGIGGKSSGSCPKSSEYGKALLSSPSAANEDGRDECSADPTSTVQIVKKEYREPWVRNCCHSHLSLSPMYLHLIP